MQRANQSEIEVKITKFGSGTQIVNVPEGSNLSETLRLAGIQLGESEKVYVNGESDAVNANDILDDGDVLSIVGRKEGGRQ